MDGCKFCGFLQKIKNKQNLILNLNIKWHDTNFQGYPLITKNQIFKLCVKLNDVITLEHSLVWPFQVSYYK